jgi:hypothetical protein
MQLCIGFPPLLDMRKDQGNNNNQNAQDNSQQPLECNESITHDRDQDDENNPGITVHTKPPHSFMQ